MKEGTKPHLPVEAMSDLSGRRIGEYHLLRKLGQGGMGQVYLAEQVSLKRKVALKILRPDLATTPQVLARFKQEAEAVAQATHANIVQVYAYGESDGVRYMALEYVEGRTLKDFIAKKGPPELAIALSIMRQVAAALQRASELGLTHRDIKPENILLTRKGEVKVADFGLSRFLEDTERPPLNLTQTGVTMGTPLYMSPEQVEGKAVDPRSDIYSFGVTCYHMLSGNPPFRGETPFEVALAHVQREPEPLRGVRPDLPEWLCAVVHKMMAKAPEGRYQTGRELYRDLKGREGPQGGNTQGSLPSIQVEPALLNTIIPADQSVVVPRSKGSQTAISSPPTLPPPPAAAPPRRVLLAAGVALTALLAAGGGAVYGWAERANEGTLPLGEPLAATDAQAVDKVLRPSAREKALKAAAEPYLSPAKGPDPRGGQEACMDLAAFYIDAGRLEEARELFARLEKARASAELHRLGQLGRALVLAMQHKARESNDLIKEVFPAFNIKTAKPIKTMRKIGPLAVQVNLSVQQQQREADQQLSPVRKVLAHRRWQYYLARAHYLNVRNGLRDEDMPAMFVSKAEEVEGRK